jgi:hypothetical protein
MNAELNSRRYGIDNNADLVELARGNIRLILTLKPHLKLALLDIYRLGRPVAQKIIEESVKAIDPSFLPALQLLAPVIRSKRTCP